MLPAGWLTTHRLQRTQSPALPALYTLHHEIYENSTFDDCAEVWGWICREKWFEPWLWQYCREGQGLPCWESSMAPFSSFGGGNWTHMQVRATGGLVILGKACAPVTTFLQDRSEANSQPLAAWELTHLDLVSNKQHGNILQRKKERRKKIPVCDDEDTLNCYFYYWLSINACSSYFLWWTEVIKIKKCQKKNQNCQRVRVF